MSAIAILAGLWTLFVALLGMWAGARYNPLEVKEAGVRIRISGGAGFDGEYALGKATVSSFNREEFVQELLGGIDKPETVYAQQVGRAERAEAMVAPFEKLKKEGGYVRQCKSCGDAFHSTEPAMLCVDCQDKIDRVNYRAKEEIYNSEGVLKFSTPFGTVSVKEGKVVESNSPHFTVGEGVTVHEDGNGTVRVKRHGGISSQIVCVNRDPKTGRFVKGEK